MKWTEAYEHSGWTIAVPVKLIHAIGAKGAILIAQLFYWKGKERTEEGWIYKTKAELEQETGLSRHEQNTCVEELKKKKVLETRYDRLDHRLYYRTCTDALDAIMEADLPGEIRKADFGKSADETAEAPAEKRTSRNPGTGRPEIRKADLVINQENTSENTTESTTTTARACAQESPKAPEEAVVVVSSCAGGAEETPTGELSGADRVQLDAIATEFGLSAKQTAAVTGHAKRKGMDYVLEQAGIVRSAPRHNLARAFMAALRDEWKPPVATAKARPKKKEFSPAPEPPPQPDSKPDYEPMVRLWAGASPEQRVAWINNDFVLHRTMPKEGEKPRTVFLARLSTLTQPTEAAA
jgi:hypothetical protein